MTRKQKRQQKRAAKKSAKKTRKSSRKQSKKDRKAAGISGVEVAILRPFKGAMISGLSRRIGLTKKQIKAKYKSNFNGLILEFYNKIVFPNRSKIRDFTSTSSFDDAMNPHRHTIYGMNIPTPAQAALSLYASHEPGEDNLVDDVVSVATSLVKAILNFFKTLKEDKDNGVPLGPLGDVAEDVSKAERDMKDHVDGEIKDYALDKAKKALPAIIGAAALLL